MILCQCTGVTDVTIETLIVEGASSLEEITARCGAGRCCAPCRDEIATLLYRAGTGPHTAPAQQAIELPAGDGRDGAMRRRGERSGA